MSGKVTVSVRLPEEVKAALAEAAAADRRSLSVFVEVVLTKHLVEAGYLPGGKSKGTYTFENLG